MKIEQNGSYLILESTVDTEFPYLCIAARIELPRGIFSGSNDGVFFGGGEEGLEKLNAFREFRTNQVRVELTEDCYIDIERHRRGDLAVAFQIAVFSGGTPVSIRGALEVEGEYSQNVVAELWKLLA